ncbi:Wzz/FepE/Etk N-terminal domain-containing protein [Rhizobium sp. EC-SD404]|uniref:GumC family protein n=1 Tax=Rhizobium sp. EC-SD404 TaxID=2038389 RepID=UPI001254E5B4|nr:Wzz/FepE/Etk N-terminal domain-containing protein [Rhizobium sp. EC-SD404]VVT16573.1 Chain-length determining protein [Rhizobium sp. EC-SD404]
MSGNLSSRGDVDIDLAGLAAALWARKFAIAASVLIVGALTYFTTSSMAPLYRSEARILIEERGSALSRTSEGGAVRDLVLDEQAIASQVEVIRSSDLLREIIAELDLGSRAEFDPAGQPSMIGDLLVLLGIGNDPIDDSAQQRVLEAVRENIQVYQVQNSRVIAIEFSSEDPELAAAVANGLAGAYLEVQSGAKLDSNAGAAAWLEPEIAELRGRVRDAEAEVAAFRAENGLLLVTENNTLVTRQLSDITTELSQVRTQRADAEARASNVRSALDAGQSADAVSSVVDSPLLQRLRERQSEIESQISDLSITLLDNHPRIRSLRSQLAGIGTQLDEEVRKALVNLEANAAVARLREEELTQQLDLLKQNSAQAGTDEVELRALEREARAERDLLETYLARFRETVSRGDPNALPADARIISSAGVPSEPYFPKVIPAVIVAMLATALIHMIIILLLELFSGRALRERVVIDETSAATPSLEPGLIATTGTATASLAHQPLAASAQPDPSLATAGPSELVTHSASAVSKVATEEEDFSVNGVAAALISKRVQVVAGISPEGDAATLGAVLLARAVSDRGHRVLTIDMTGAGIPGATMAGTGLPGITDLLCGSVSIAESIHADYASSADIIPLGTADPETAMRGASRIAMIIEALSDAYDTIIVECGSTEITSVQKMLADRPITVVMSVVDPDASIVAEEFEALVEAGFDDALIMLVDEDGPQSTRSNAA